MHKQAHPATHTLVHALQEPNQLWHQHQAPFLISPSLQTPPTAVVIFILPHNIQLYACALSLRSQRLCIPNIRKLKNTVTPTREMVAGAVKNCL